MPASKIAVVTGANRGIGYEIARQLAAHDVFDVVATSRDPKAGEEAAARIGARPAQLDVTHDDSVKALADSLSGVDVLINNAGIALDGFNASVARRTLDANYFGAVRVTEALLPKMRPGGHIVMVSSGAGELTGLDARVRAQLEDASLTRAQLDALLESFVRDVADGVHEERGWPSSAYRVSKLGLNAYTRVLARQLVGDPRGLTVNAMCPGWVRTRMGGEAAPRSPEEGARTAVWLALREDRPTGGFFRDEKRIPW